MTAKWVAVSGGFDPIHCGHLSYFEEAKKLGTHLLVILNTDEWLMKKKGYVFMPYNERAKLIQALACVDLVLPQLDEDMTVSHSLRVYAPKIFAKGGDRTADNVPELEICNALGIEVVFGVGEDKVIASSDLVGNVFKKLLVLAGKKQKKIRSNRKRGYKCASYDYVFCLQNIVRDVLNDI
jgi:D-beta-D-heptose 7-phosphate kinase/D-beta-D-heptose 1-phosphate adenosyltransferase